MNGPASLYAAISLLVISFAHIIRMLVGVQIMVSGIAIPAWVNAPSAALMAFWGFWLLMERRSVST